MARRPVRAAVLRLMRADDPETGWLVRIAFTAVLTWAVATAGAGRLVLFACYAGWLVFLATDHRFPRVARTALAVTSVLPAVVVALPDNGPALLFLYGALFTFVLLPDTPLWAILTTSGSVLAVLLTGLLLAGRGPVALLTQPAFILGLLLFNLHRREHRLRAEQTTRLLAETTRAQEAVARAAALDERTRIARELHDVLAHALGALGVQLAAAEAQLTERADVDGAAERIRRARRLAADGLVEARSAVNALRADVPPLSRALDGLVAAHGTDHAASVTLRTDGTPRALPPAAEVSLLSTAREALTNAARHAPGAPVSVVLGYRSAAVRLTVANPVAGGRGGTVGFGLTGARERVALAGGTLEAGVVDGAWRMTAEVPG